MDFRHEWKHEISWGDMLALRARLSAVMEPDPHAVDGRYTIRSLYFDSPGDKALREKIDGVNRREKFRLRCYNADPSLILLEKKVKQGGLCGKVQARLTPEDALALASGCREASGHPEDPLFWELRKKMDWQGLGPKTVVEYTREPFVFAPGNVRVTLDYALRTGTDCRRFLEPDCLTIPAREQAVILEVKWDGYLPSLIRDLVQTPGTHTGAFSKYAACRAYG